jgi:hypothetical protein
MKSLKIIIAFILLSPAAQTQKRVIIDELTKQPIPYVNIYFSKNKIVEGTTSDQNGFFDVKFDYNVLHFSHINYEKTIINKADLKDSVFLKPTSFLLGEVVVTKKESFWIKEKLKLIAKEKHKKYQVSEETVSYRYETYSLTNTSGYEFLSDGFLLIPTLMNKKDAYFINPTRNIIRYKDETAKANFSDLRRIVYDDFIQSFDSKFIKNHTFHENIDYERENMAHVWLSFTLNKDEDTKGYIIIDTLNNVILESEYNVGTKQNIKNQTSTILRNYSKKIGVNYEEWITCAKTRYEKADDNYRMNE